MTSQDVASRYWRIVPNCKIIWGDKDYDFKVEGGKFMFEPIDGKRYQVFVGEDCGDHWGPNLTVTPLYVEEETAWRELNIMLSGSAENVLRKRREDVAAKENA
jgi:hypothetical protein